VRALVQRVTRARVTVREGRDRDPDDDGEGEVVVGQIGAGLCVLVGVTHADDETSASRLAAKLWRLRVFDDADGLMNLAVADTGGEVLVISQFTLYGDTSKGRRPSWIDAARPDYAEPLIDLLADELRVMGATVATGRFGADMSVELVNDGPVTVLIET
jgi:D-tyrosyl-tRNA(Tyr) deacylase